MKSCMRVLIPVNGTTDALRKGLEMVEDDHCWITVLKVLPEYDGDIDMTGVKDINTVISSERRRVEEELESMVRDEAGARIRVEYGSAAETINRVAEDEVSDLIIMDSGRHGGIIGRLLGSGLVRKVAGRAPCPVMVVD